MKHFLLYDLESDIPFLLRERALHRPATVRMQQQDTRKAAGAGMTQNDAIWPCKMGIDMLETQATVRQRLANQDQCKTKRRGYYQITSADGAR